jgi:hypothetical protein
VLEGAPEIKPEPWYKNTKLSSVDTRTLNRIITTHTSTPNWLAKMGVVIEGVCDLCKEHMGIQYILYTCMKFTRRRLTCNCLDKQIPLKVLYKKGDSVGINNKIFEGHQNERLKRSKIN